jgi:hypothetical protein
MPRTTRHPKHRCSLLVLAVGLTACWDHALYDGKVNRFDTYYLGGGNSAFRPFRSARVDDDAGFGLDLVARSDQETGVLVLTGALHDAGAPESVGGALYWSGESRREVARFGFDGDESLVLEVPWRQLAAGLEAGHELEAEFVDAQGATIVLRFGESELREALAEQVEVDR